MRFPIRRAARPNQTQPTLTHSTRSPKLCSLMMLERSRASVGVQFALVGLAGIAIAIDWTKASTGSGQKSSRQKSFVGPKRFALLWLLFGCGSQSWPSFWARPRGLAAFLRLAPKSCDPSVQSMIQSSLVALIGVFSSLAKGPKSPFGRELRGNFAGLVPFNFGSLTRNHFWNLSSLDTEN